MLDSLRAVSLTAMEPLFFEDQLVASHLQNCVIPVMMLFLLSLTHLDPLAPALLHLSSTLDASKSRRTMKCAWFEGKTASKQNHNFGLLRPNAKTEGSQRMPISCPKETLQEEHMLSHTCPTHRH